MTSLPRLFFYHCIAAVLGTFFFGWVLENKYWGAIVSLSIMLGWHLYHLNQLLLLIQPGNAALVFEGPGVWGRIYARLYYRRRKRKKNEAKLKDALSQFRRAARALPDALVALSDEDTVLWCNPAASELMKLHMPADRGRPIQHLLRHPSVKTFLEQNDYSASIEILAPQNASRVLSLHLVPFGDEYYRLLIARDMTAIRKLESMRRDFVANVSHEMRSPLTVLQGYLENMDEAQVPALAVWHQPILAMRQQTAKLLSLIEGLMQLVKLESDMTRPVLQAVRVYPILEDTIAQALALSGEQQHHIALVADKEVSILGVENELSSVFSNLIINAVKHTPAGTSITVTCQELMETVIFSVSDQGQGMASEHLPRLTERFYQVDKSRTNDNGTGLGLAIVKYILQRHNALFDVQSRLGEGSCFTCTFPKPVTHDDADVI